MSRQDAVGQGVSYVVFWRSAQQFGEEPFKICLTIYQKGVLQVSLKSIKMNKNYDHIPVPGDRA